MFSAVRGYTVLEFIPDWAHGITRPNGDLSGGGVVGYDSCLAGDSVYFIKQNAHEGDPGILARVPTRSTPGAVELIAGMPFNLGRGCAIEFVPGKWFADAHERLFIVQGGNPSPDAWWLPSNSQQLAIYDLVARTWSLEDLPFAVDHSCEMSLVDDTLYILASNQDPAPLKMARFASLGEIPKSPQLSASYADGQLQLEWDFAASGFVLEQSTDLLPDASWSLLVSGTNRYTASPTPSTAPVIYRLRLP